MSSRRRRAPLLSDSELLAREDGLALLRAVAAGRVVRGDRGGATDVWAPHYLDGELVRLELRWLANQELIVMPISGPPSVAPRGVRLLAVLNGEASIARD